MDARDCHLIISGAPLSDIIMEIADSDRLGDLATLNLLQAYVDHYDPSWEYTSAQRSILEKLYDKVRGMGDEEWSVVSLGASL